MFTQVQDINDFISKRKTRTTKIELAQ